jgi:VWFA-related protein
MRTRLAVLTLILATALAAPPLCRLAIEPVAAQQPASGGSTQAPPAAAPDTAPPQDGQAPSGAGAPGQAAPRGPTFRAGINFVRVDVIVTDKKGQPVLDLKPTDFTVTEDGKPQTVDSFKLINVDDVIETTPPREIRTSFDEESEAQREDVRLFAVFLDDYHVRRGSAMYARAPVANFIRTQLRPSDMVALMYPLTPLGDVVMSRNHEAMARAVENFDGRKYDYVPRNQFEEQYARYPAEVVERIRNQVSLSALRSLVTHLGSLREGRKAVILVSEGYTNYLPPQMRDPNASMPGYGNPMHGAVGVEATGNMNEDRAQFFSAAEMVSDLREVYDTANKNNTAIYALDPRGLAPFEHDIDEGVGLQTDKSMLQLTQNTIRTLADETDGRAIVNQNDLGKGLKQILRDTSVYYLLGYNSTQAPQDGKFHAIKVKVNRPGIEVRHRKGYWALTAADTARILAPKKEPPKEFDSALAAISTRSRTQPDVIRTWVGTSRGENGKTKVTFVWEPIPPAPGSRRDPPARVSLMAVAPDGSPLFRGKAPDVAVGSAIQITDASPASASSSSSGATNGGSGPAEPGSASPRGPSQIVFEVPPGPMQLRYQVEDGHATVLDTNMHDYTVPDLTAPQVQLSTPEVLRARTVKEFRDLSADARAVPTAAREFRRTDRLIVRVDAYGPGGASPAVSARLLNRAGDPMNDLTVSTPAPGPTHQVDLPLAGIAAAEYIIEITAKGESGNAKQLVAFRVVS